jgi:enoyl-CoA hydratase
MTEPYKHLVVEVADRILTCKLHNPPRHTLNHAMLVELEHLLDRLERDDEDIRVVIFTGGTDGIFLRWFELSEIQKVGDEAEKSAESGGAQLTTAQALGVRIEQLPQVTIAAINGFAAGGACGLALCFDFRLLMSGDPKFMFGLPQTTFGITTCGGQSVRLVRMIGVSKSMDLLLHGTLLPPDEALRIGLVSRVYPRETYFSDVAAFAQNLARRAPLALKGQKKLVREAFDKSMHAGLLNEVVEYTKVVRTDDAKRALAAVNAIEDPDPTTFGSWSMDFYGR